MSLDLGGESEKILLVTPQIVCHPIDAESPLDRLNKKDLEYLLGEVLEKFNQSFGVVLNFFKNADIFFICIKISDSYAVLKKLYIQKLC